MPRVASVMPRDTSEQTAGRSSQTFVDSKATRRQAAPLSASHSMPSRQTRATGSRFDAEELAVIARHAFDADAAFRALVEHHAGWGQDIDRQAVVRCVSNSSATRAIADKDAAHAWAQLIRSISACC